MHDLNDAQAMLQGGTHPNLAIKTKYITDIDEGRLVQMIMPLVGGVSERLQHGSHAHLQVLVMLYDERHDHIVDDADVFGGMCVAEFHNCENGR